MASKGKVPSFDDFIKEDRQKKRERERHAELASEIFGRGRKDKDVPAGPKKFGAGPSLASRVGVAKASQRSSSNSPKPRIQLDVPQGSEIRGAENGRPRPTRLTRQSVAAEKRKTEMLSEALSAKGALNQPRPKSTGPEISIRGAAGPYVVIGSNFAPGTTAADIESAMVPPGADIQSCRIITASPTVMAEMVFSEKRHADNIIEMFNNKKADGRILHVYMKTGGPTLITNSQEEGGSAANSTRSDTMPRQSSPQRQTNRRGVNHAQPEVQDGRYGFDDKGNEMEVDDTMDASSSQRHEPWRDDQERFRGGTGRREGIRPYEPPRGPGRDRYYAREWDRRRDTRAPYSDNYYSHSRNGGYR